MYLLASEILVFECFSIVSLWRLSTPGAWSNLTPGAWLTQFIMGTTKHCYIQNTEALCLQVLENKIVLVFPIVSLWELSVAMETTILIQSAQKP